MPIINPTTEQLGRARKMARGGASPVEIAQANGWPLSRKGAPLFLKRYGIMVARQRRFAHDGHDTSLGAKNGLRVDMRGPRAGSS